MTERKLLEIPIYSMSKETFLKRWNHRYDKRVQDLMLSGHRTYETAKKDARVCTFPYNVWEYNQIIGYIVISSLSMTSISINFGLWIRYIGSILG